jgi:hypothetical protein
MKLYIKTIIILILIIYLENIMCYTVVSGLTYHKLPDDYNYENIINVINLRKVNDEYKGTSSIRSFDVDSKGNVAIGFNPLNSNNQRINVYNIKGEFLYGYIYFDNGASLIEFDMNSGMLLLFFSRGSLICKINTSGEIIEISEIDISSDNLKHIKTMWNNKSIDRNGAEYYRSALMKNCLLSEEFVGFTSLDVNLADTTSLTIFANTFQHWACIIAVVSAFPLFIARCIFIIIRFIKRKKKVLFP